MKTVNLGSSVRGRVKQLPGAYFAVKVDKVEKDEIDENRETNSLWNTDNFKNPIDKTNRILRDA